LPSLIDAYIFALGLEKWPSLPVFWRGFYFLQRGVKTITKIISSPSLTAHVNQPGFILASPY